MKLLGGILLIMSMSLGAAMLALPVVTAPSGFLPATALLFACWALMTFSAFLLLEVNLWLPENSNIISMAKMTLGRPGQCVTWISYLFLLYTLISAFISGGGDIVHDILKSCCHYNAPGWLNDIIFVLVFASVIYHGIHFVDLINRGLMFVKLGVYLLLVSVLSPHIEMENLTFVHPQTLLPIITVAITAYGFSIIIPSLRTYFNSDIKQLRKVVFFGSLVPLVCYIVWVLVVLGTLPLDGEHGLRHVLHSGHAATEMAKDLKQFISHDYVAWFAQGFTALCIMTSFLGVALSLTDFLSDGLRVSKRGRGSVLIYSLTFIPPILVVLFYPNVFINCLNYAGYILIFLMIIIPILMTWRGRYILQMADDYRVSGGKFSLVLGLILSIAVIIIEMFHPVLN